MRTKSIKLITVKIQMPSDFHFCSLLCFTIHLFIIRNVPECSRAFRVIYPKEIYENVLENEEKITALCKYVIWPKRSISSKCFANCLIQRLKTTLGDLFITSTCDQLHYAQETAWNSCVPNCCQLSQHTLISCAVSLASCVSMPHSHHPAWHHRGCG